MKLLELKKVLKPFIKQCIKEALLEEGILSGVIKEVAVGLRESQTSQQPIQEQQKPFPAFAKKNSQKSDISETKRKLLESIGREAYNGIDIFENTTPIKESKRNVEPNTGQAVPGPMAGLDPSDKGIDLSIFGIKV